jgi:acetyl-CoA carboxylase carboxyltransferase component
MDKSSFSGDGVVTGSGLIAGRPVFVYSQDFTGEAIHACGVLLLSNSAILFACTQ